jgi:predicted TPR repeat methyltransferase
MEQTLPELPDVQQISGLVQAWASTSPVFAAALRLGVSTAAALARLGLHLCQENRAAEAVTVFLAAVALEPSNSLFWVNLAVALDRTAALAEAAGCLERSLAIADSQPAAWLLLGTVRTKMPDLAGAEAAYREAVRLEGDSPLAWQCLGLVKQEQGELAAAIDCFTRCVARRGGTAGVLANLGKLYYEMGRIPEAAEAYASAVELDAGNPNYLHMLRRLHLLRDVLAGGPVDEALAAYQRSLLVNAPEAETDLNAVLQSAFLLLRGFGHLEAAARVGRKWRERAPGSAAADYLLKALTGGPGVERSPATYLVEYFDGYAEAFDEKLVKALRYDLPATLCSTIERVAAPGRRFDTLDSGCGTGLCGPLLRPMARELTGVDLSPKMLEQARRRGVYDTLFCEELLTFLKRSAGRFDLVVAADVLVYFGDLRPVWMAAREALRPGGLLVFSTELAVGESYRLQTSGRFAHSLAYVRSTTATLYEERAWAETTIRQEAGEPVRGNCFVLHRR